MPNYKMFQEKSIQTLAINPNHSENHFVSIHLENLLPLKQYKNGMTPLHRAAFYEDSNTIEHILLNNEDEILKEILLNNYVTPFYLAASRGNNQICCKILHHVKKIVKIDELKKSFFFPSLKDAIGYGNPLMFRTIIESIKTELGLNYLKEVLSIKFSEDVHFASLSCFNKSTLREMIDVIVRENGEQYNWFLLENKLFLESHPNMFQFEFFGEVFQSQMLKAIDFRSCVKTILDSDIAYGFFLFAVHLFDNLNTDQQKTLVDIVTCLENETKMSYLSRWFIFENLSNYKTDPTFGRKYFI